MKNSYAQSEELRDIYKKLATEQRREIALLRQRVNAASNQQVLNRGGSMEVDKPVQLGRPFESNSQGQSRRQPLQ